MSPLTLRRYRAERLLREEFAGLRNEVLAAVGARLRARGVRLDRADLDACYAAAWHGLYAAVLDGREIANPAGWLALVTYRRAIDEHRSRRRAPATPMGSVDGEAVSAPLPEPDLAGELDDRARLRQLFEALRGRLSERECEAASLCYLQGLSRADAAARMGIGAAGMRKLMEGRGPGSTGVAGKVGELLRTISGGGWCEQQASLMRGLAFGILDPRGERYRLARLHQRECPACRAYVLSLRGLAAVLPLPALPWGLGIGAAAGAGAGAKAGAGIGSGAGAGSGMGAGTGAGGGMGAGAGTGAGVGAGASAGAGSGVGAGLTSAGAAGVGAAGGGWLLGGSVGAKLAVSCLLALGVGCVALVAPHHRAGAHRRAHRRGAPPPAYLASASAGSGAGIRPAALGSASPGGLSGAGSSSTGSHTSRPASLGGAASTRRAQSEFGPEQPSTPSASAGSTTARAVTARASLAGASISAGSTSTAPSGSTASPTSTASRREGPSGAEPKQAESRHAESGHAEREFGP